VTITVVMEGNKAPGERGRRYRESATRLFENATGRTDIDVVLAGGRSEASQEFTRRLTGGSADLVLLVDSEELVDPQHSVWEHLAALPPESRIVRPEGAGEDDGQLMVVVTETWVLSGLHFPTNTPIDPLFLDEHAETEGIDKQAVARDAKHVFGATKLKHRVLVKLAEVDHRRLRVKCPFAHAFFERLAVA
jgi:hypothetical protein